MRDDIQKARDFIDKLKKLKTTGQDEYPYCYVYQDDFNNLLDIVNAYEKLVEFISDEIDKIKYFGDR